MVGERLDNKERDWSEEGKKAKQKARDAYASLAFYCV